MSNYQVSSPATTGFVQTIVSGANISVNNTSPENPIVSVSNSPTFSGVVSTNNNTLDDGSGNSIFIGNETINKNLTINVNKNSNNEVFIIYNNPTTGDLALRVSTQNNQILTTGVDFIVLGTTPSYTNYFRVIGNASNGIPGTITTLNNTLDDSFGNASFLSSVTSNAFGSSGSIVLTVNSSNNSTILMNNANFSTGAISFESTADTFLHSNPISIISGATPTPFGGYQTGVQIYSSVSGITGYSVPYYQDEAGNNYPWGTSTSSFKINKQIFTSSGIYTPSVGLSYAYVEVVKAGGSANGEYASGFFSASKIGYSQFITVGNGKSEQGVANAGSSSFGSLITDFDSTEGSKKVNTGIVIITEYF